MKANGEKENDVFYAMTLQGERDDRPVCQSVQSLLKRNNLWERSDIIEEETQPNNNR